MVLVKIAICSGSVFCDIYWIDSVNLLGVFGLGIANANAICKFTWSFPVRNWVFAPSSASPPVRLEVLSIRSYLQELQPEALL